MSDEMRVMAGGTEIRIQRISKSVVRVEAVLPDGGFVDESTFTIVARPEPEGPLLSMDKREKDEFVRFGAFSIGFGHDGIGRSNVPDVCVSTGGKTVWSVSTDRELHTQPPQPQRFPGPEEPAEIWAFHDRPRLIPPRWGSLPPPDSDNAPDSGWNVADSLFDVYLIFYEGNRNLLREEFMNLTGRIPVPPLWTFGFWTSRYYPYSEETAYDVMGRYEEMGIPLDVFVLDTDWRVGGSRGYEINNELFPDMKRFLGRCRERGIRTVFNDHPEPLGREPLDPELFRYRRENLIRLFEMGLSAWWFDRNWGDIIQSPVPGMSSAVWGQKLYHDIAESYRPEERPVVLSMTHPHAASHRYPIWWTGDNNSDWRALGESVEDTLEDGLQLRPYTAPDIGGHVGFPSPEQYVRWLQWGSVAPTMRLHCGPHNRYRYPWRFGPAVLAITRDYIRMRYRLLPYLYSLAHEARQSGLPILRAPDLTDNSAPVWARRTQFTIGESFLAAPVLTTLSSRITAPQAYRFEKPLRRRAWVPDEKTRQHLRNRTFPEYQPYEEGYDHEIRLPSWYTTDSTPPEGTAYLVIWEGELKIPQHGRYMFRAIGNGTKSLFVDDAKFGQLFSIFDSGTNEACLELETGSHRFWFGFWHHGGQIPACLLNIEREPEAEELMDLPSEKRTLRKIRIPEGGWRDLRSGAIHTGPVEITKEIALDEMPMFVRCGSIIPLSRGEYPLRDAYWKWIDLEVFPHTVQGSSRCELVEDDGETVRYKDGLVVRTGLVLTTDSGRIVIEKRAAETAADAGDHETRYRIRLHLMPGRSAESVHIENRGTWRVLSESRQRFTPLPLDTETAIFSGSDTVIIEPDGVWSCIEVTTGTAAKNIHE